MSTFAQPTSIGWKPMYLTDHIDGDSCGIAGWKPTFRVAAVRSV